MDSKSYKILFVDDDELVLDMYAVKFNQSPHTVQFANSADSARKILQDGFKPDAVVFDVMMPGTQGFDMIEQFKNEGLIDDKTVLIALTNQNEDTDYKRAEKLGVHEYMVKAAHIPSEVLSIIETTIQKFKDKN